MKKVHEYIATIFGLGYFAVASGTVGSFAGLIVCLLLHRYIFLYVGVFLVLFAAGVISAGKKEAETNQKDPACVIIDEFACIFLVFLFIPLTPLYIIAGFIIYRVMDIVKLPPMRTIEKLKGGWGIMLDDAVAAIYSNIILHIISSFI
ncbi:MAG: phosphatidylglycerophosphatase A [Candidatus Omnitrophota bacterium]